METENRYLPPVAFSRLPHAGDREIRTGGFTPSRADGKEKTSNAQFRVSGREGI